ncbi:MAG: hypothetical protein A2Z02_06035 [Chloroflexi bacterium RBG_16_48_7]|nr:MAG: hypothetical protein A2Z02_06035 [Chloroflexi bacterium RBG_16_48_7]
MENNSKIGGILSIVSGAMGVFSGIMVAFMGIFFAVFIPTLSRFDRFSSPPPFDGYFAIFAVVYGGMGFFLMLIGALSIVGGAFALKKRHWGWALAGSIAGSYVFFATGIAAVIFTAMAKNEFQQSSVKEGTIQA